MSNKTRHGLWLVAGVYLAYNGISLFVNVMKEKPDNYMMFSAAGVLFVLFGAYIAVQGIKGLRKKQDSTESQPEKEETEVQEIEKKEETESRDGEEIMRIGLGDDVHRLTEGRKLILGGVEIPYEKGLLGHSDADVLLHAVMDALLGAAALGDIGKHFPDTDDAYKGASSMKLLAKVGELIEQEVYVISNIDATIIAQKPKMAPYIEKMRENIAGVLRIDKSQVNVKATTEEGLGFTGTGEGISAQAVACLETIANYSYAVGEEGCAGCKGCPREV